MKTVQEHPLQTSPVLRVPPLTEESASSFTKSLSELLCFSQSYPFTLTNSCLVISEFSRVTQHTNIRSQSSLRKTFFSPHLQISVAETPISMVTASGLESQPQARVLSLPLLPSLYPQLSDLLPFCLHFPPQPIPFLSRARSSAWVLEVFSSRLKHLPAMDLCQLLTLLATAFSSVKES